MDGSAGSFDGSAGSFPDAAADTWADPELEVAVGRVVEPLAPVRLRAVPDLTRLAATIRPTVLAAERQLPVDPVLAPLLAGGALTRGTTVRVAGPGSTSLVFALVAATSQTGGWVGFVGGAELGWLAAADQGLDLSRVLVVDPVPADRWGEVMATLVDAVDVVVTIPEVMPAHAAVRRLAARARERGTVLVVGGGRPWPVEPDVTMHATDPAWEGLGVGHGRLTARSLSIRSSGRRGAAVRRQVQVWLPTSLGTLAPSAGEHLGGHSDGDHSDRDHSDRDHSEGDRLLDHPGRRLRAV
jgi:hypothetical protein